MTKHSQCITKAAKETVKTLHRDKKKTKKKKWKY